MERASLFVILARLLSQAPPGGESCSPGFERRRITSNDISKGDSADQSLFYNFTKANYLIAFNTKNFNADCNGGRVVVIAPGLIIT
ncbi:hypothetical protein OUZ56_027606 [Daphnia magna]|uniref:Uncharacterized protein n=1 Tax=Daphnia magna TaxID=35525 RepID=A0ABR0B1J2_9CRUS|nr:hypothetical protein OUZ56_027606 [Daphnia magna]